MVVTQSQNGKILVARAGKNVGDKYVFNWEEYQVSSIYAADPEYCWIKRGQQFPTARKER
jgi:hypothetical protein